MWHAQEFVCRMMEVALNEGLRFYLSMLAWGHRFYLVFWTEIWPYGWWPISWTGSWQIWRSFLTLNCFTFFLLWTAKLWTQLVMESCQWAVHVNLAAASAKLMSVILHCSGDASAFTFPSVVYPPWAGRCIYFVSDVSDNDTWKEHLTKLLLATGQHVQDDWNDCHGLTGYLFVCRDGICSWCLW